MHPDNEPITLGAGTLYMIDQATGEETPLGQVNTDHETIEADPIDTSAVLRINTGEEASFTATLQVQRMSRKRFIKTLMGYCISRNRANAVAKIARDRGHPYGWAFTVILFTGFQLWAESQAMTCEEE